MAYGSGDYVYDLAEDWGRLPEGYEFNQVAGVAVDKDDNVYLFNRSSHQMMVFDRGGSFIKAWSQTFSNPHGVHIGPDGNIYVADRDAHVVQKYSPDEELLLTLGTRGQSSDTGYGAEDRVVHRGRRALQPAHGSRGNRIRRHVRLRRLRELPAAQV